MPNTGNKKYSQAFIEHFKNIKNKEKFREEFENIFGVQNKWWKSKEDNWEWWFDTIANDKNIIAKLNSDNKMPRELIKISEKLQSYIYKYLWRNFDNPHLKISDNQNVSVKVVETLKDYFKNHIIPEIINGDKTKQKQDYYNLAKSPLFINNSGATDDKTLTKMWNLYLKEINQGNITADKLIMHALSDILNDNLQYIDQNNDTISIQCNKRSDFVIKTDNHNIHIKHLGHGFSSKESIKKLKKNSKYVIKDLEIKPTEGCVEHQIAKYIFSMNGKNESLDSIWKSKKTLVLFVKSDQIINSEKLKEELKKAWANKNQQSKHEEWAIEETNNQTYKEPLKGTPQYQPAKNDIETETSSESLIEPVLKSQDNGTLDNGQAEPMAQRKLKENGSDDNQKFQGNSEDPPRYCETYHL